MMLYLYAPTLNDGVLELARSIGARRLKKFDGISFWKFGKRVSLSEGDIVVCWGKPLPEMEGIRILNGGDPSTKHQDLKTLMNAGSLVIPYRNQSYPQYLQRSNKSVSGNDILKLARGLSVDFYTTRVNFGSEVVIHSFDGRTIRSGKKVPKDGFIVAPTVEVWEENRKKETPEKFAHPWVKTDLGGWKVDYEGFKSTMNLRKQAAAAVKQLELTFGAVTFGYRAEDERYYILGVDRAPLIDGTTINSYSRAINRWMKDEKPEEEENNEPIPEAPPMIPIQVDGWNQGAGVAQWNNPPAFLGNPFAEDAPQAPPLRLDPYDAFAGQIPVNDPVPPPPPVFRRLAVQDDEMVRIERARIRRRREEMQMEAARQVMRDLRRAMNPEANNG